MVGMRRVSAVARLEVRMFPVRRRFVRFTSVCAALLLLGSSGCGDDDKGGGPNGGGDAGEFGDIAEALTDAEDQLLVANTAVYASVDFFAPLIVTALSAAGIQAAGVQEACVPAGSLGQTFEFDGATYVAAPDAAVPANGTRFRLYQMTPGGTPNLAAPIGYVVITCTQDEVAGIIGTIDVTFGSATVFSLTAEIGPGVLAVNGTMRGPSGSPALQYQGGAVLTTDITIGFIFPGQFSVSYGEYGDAGEGPYLVADVTGPYPNAEWQFYTHINFDQTGDFTQGYAQYSATSEYGVVACVSSGSLEEPVFSAPSSSCAQGGPIMTTSVAERQAMADGLKALRSLWLTVTGFIELGLSAGGSA